MYWNDKAHIKEIYCTQSQYKRPMIEQPKVGSPPICS